MTIACDPIFEWFLEFKTPPSLDTSLWLHSCVRRKLLLAQIPMADWLFETSGLSAYRRQATTTVTATWTSEVKDHDDVLNCGSNPLLYRL